MNYTKTGIVCGWGINDADYPVYIYESWYDESGAYKRKLTWKCPYYIKWRSMIGRCHSESVHKSRPTYKDCSVCEDWKYFSNFKLWMESQDWEGMELDKDLIQKDNKIYSPETCFFVSSTVNCFMLERKLDKGDLPIGVTLRKSTGKYTAVCRDYRTRSRIFLGDFKTIEEAFNAWLSKKLKMAIELAKTITNPVVADLLVQRYLNYKD